MQVAGWVRGTKLNGAPHSRVWAPLLMGWPVAGFSSFSSPTPREEGRRRMGGCTPEDPRSPGLGKGGRP